MPVNVRLSDDKRYLIYEMSEPLEIAELMDAYRQEREYRDAHDYTMHSLVDMSKVNRIPPNWLTAKAGPGLTHARSGRMVFVGISYGLRIIVQTILKIARYDKMQFFDTYEEALDYMVELVELTIASEADTISTR